MRGRSWPRACTLAHTIKGVAGNLGAERLHGAAAALEAELKRETPGNVEPLLHALSATAVELMPGLEALETAPAARDEARPVPVDRALVGPVLRKLARLLRDDDMAADACLNHVEELLGTFAASDLVRVRECVDNLEFTEALEPLSRIAEALGVTPDA